MLLPPGPEQSSLMMTLRRGWAEQLAAMSSSTIASGSFVLMSWQLYPQAKRSSEQKSGQNGVPALPRVLALSKPLEPQFQRKLNQARVVHRIGYDSKGRRSIDVLL